MSKDRPYTMANRHLIVDYDRPKTLKRDAIWPPDHDMHEWINSLSPQMREAYLGSDHPLVIQGKQDIKRMATHAAPSASVELANTKSFQDAVNSKSQMEQKKVDDENHLISLLNVHREGCTRDTPTQIALSKTKGSSSQIMQVSPTNSSTSMALFPPELQTILNSLNAPFKEEAIDIINRNNANRKNKFDFFKHPETLLIHKDILSKKVLPLNVFKSSTIATYTEDFFYMVATVYGECGSIEIGYAPVASVILKRAHLGWHGCNPGITIAEANAAVKTSETPVKIIDHKTKFPTKVKIKKKKKHKPSALTIFCDSITEVCLFTGFDACFGPLGKGKYGSNSAFLIAIKVINFLIDFDFDENKYINEKFYQKNQSVIDTIVDIIQTLFPLYSQYINNKFDFEKGPGVGATIYYSPGAMPKAPYWVNTKDKSGLLMYEEVFPEGFPNNIDPKNHKKQIRPPSFKFYRYTKKWSKLKS